MIFLFYILVVSSERLSNSEIHTGAFAPGIRLHVFA